LSVLYKTYIATLNSLSTVTTLTLTSLSNATYTLSKILISIFTGNKKNINQLKVDFFTTFFKNFLTWNYLLNSFSKNQTNKAFKDLVVSKRNNKFKITPPKLNFLKNSTNLVSLFGLFKTHLLSDLFLKIKIIVYKSFSFSWYYLSGFTFILFIDACLTDDEPLWEPIEWSLVQTWILFIFSFAWIAENLIVSRYGSYAGRDKRVWMAWYKTFWLIEGYYVLNYGIAVILVIVPFYFELNYNLSFIYSWWNWFSKVFFFKFTLMYSIILLMSIWLQINTRWVGYKKALIIITLVNIILGYLIYTQFIIIFFGYFTDPLWYQKTRYVDYVQLSHEPAKWGWGSSKKDHFTYHGVRTVLWFKNDGPFATSFLFCQIFFFICLFCLFIYWVVLFRRVYSLSEVPMTYLTYCVSSLKQFFFFFLFFYIFIILSFLANYWRFPIEYFFTCEYKSWYVNFSHILLDYPVFIYKIITLS
jgi:hypothetical protein